MTSEPAWKPTRQWRRHVYYKVQVYDGTSMVWRDEKPAFDALDEAKSYIRVSLPPDSTTRIMLVDGRERKPLDD